MNIMNLSELVTLVHVIGVALGFGGAMISDAIFFSSVKDKKFTSSEVRFMKLGGSLVWVGIVILITSGVALVYLKPELLQSSKFLAKLVIVGVIILNGILFHAFHIPNIQANINKSTKKNAYFQKKGHLVTMSGAVSVVSWLSATFLGSLSGIALSFGEIMYI